MSPNPVPVGIYADPFPTRPVEIEMQSFASVPPHPGRWAMVTSFFAPGIPRPGGSKTAHVVRRKGGEIVTSATGRPLVTMRDDAKGNKEWRSVVALAATVACSAMVPLEGPLALRVVFTMPRPKGHYGAGKNAGVLRPTAPRWPTTKPDATKLLRSTEDALTGILWRDDAAIVLQWVEKAYGEKPGARITLYRRAVTAG